MYPTQHSFSTERGSGGGGREVPECSDHRSLIKRQMGHKSMKHFAQNQKMLKRGNEGSL